jgi:hypothetical protein
MPMSAASTLALTTSNSARARRAMRCSVLASASGSLRR